MIRLGLECPVQYRQSVTKALRVQSACAFVCRGYDDQCVRIECFAACKDRAFVQGVRIVPATLSRKHAGECRQYARAVRRGGCESGSSSLFGQVTMAACCGNIGYQGRICGRGTGVVRSDSLGVSVPGEFQEYMRVRPTLLPRRFIARVACEDRNCTIVVSGSPQIHCVSARAAACLRRAVADEHDECQKGKREPETPHDSSPGGSSARLISASLVISASSSRS